MNRAAATGVSLLGVAVLAGAVLAVVRIASREREAPARCARELVAQGPRCCAPGQTLARGHCSGRPASCPEGMHLADTGDGCVVDARRIAFAGGRLSLGVEDWQAEGVVQPRSAWVTAFELDRAEVTVERWRHCVRAGVCRTIDEAEPGRPVVGVEVKEAERFCRSENGRLPTGDEWLFAAMGPETRKFPWGATGLVCRRSAYGLSGGPCAQGGGVELAGSRPDGATPEGVLDLSGNVAEYTVERDARPLARGGSFASASALELTSWAADSMPKAARTGFRCAYDRASSAASATIVR